MLFSYIVDLCDQGLPYYSEPDGMRCIVVYLFDTGTWYGERTEYLILVYGMESIWILGMLNWSCTNIVIG